MKRIVILAVAIGLFFCSTASAFQRGGGESTKTGSSKNAVAKRKTFVQAKKVRTVTGHLCGADHSAGPYVGTIYFRLRRGIIDIQHQFKVIPGYEKTTTLTRYINHPDFDKIGFKYVVRYQIIIDRTGLLVLEEQVSGQKSRTAYLTKKDLCDQRYVVHP